MKHQPPPVLLTIFNRPQQTAELFEIIKQIKPSKLFISADGPRANIPGDKAACRATRNVILVDWECETWWHTKRKNLGESQSVYEGASWFFKYVEEGIVLPDDCLPDLSFFALCQDLLTRYRNDDRIFGITTDSIFLESHLAGESKPSELTRTFGWAAWRRSWKLLDLYQTGQRKLQKSNRIATARGRQSVAFGGAFEGDAGE